MNNLILAVKSHCFIWNSKCSTGDYRLMNNLFSFLLICG